MIEGTQILRERAGLIDEMLEAQIESLNSSPMLRDAMKSTLFPGGKRIRPVLTIMSCELANGNIDDVLPAAVAYELLHNFTLVHQDLMDRTWTRTEVSPSDKYGSSAAILTGDLMLAMAYGALHMLPKRLDVPSKAFTAFAYFNETCSKLAAGQAKNFELRRAPRPDFSTFKSVVDYQVSSLFVGPLKTGAFIGGADEETLDVLELWGMLFGHAYQIRRDLHDFQKEKYNALRNGWRNTVTIHALSKLNKDRDSLLEIMDKPPSETSDGDIEEAVDIIGRVNSVRFAEKELYRVSSQARSLVAPLDDQESKRNLIALFDHIFS